MTKLYIKYMAGYKYQLAEDYTVRTDIITAILINTEYIQLTPGGFLTGRAGYAWDGASSIAIDTPKNMRPSLGHDMKYQLMREGHIGQGWRKIADKEFRKECLEDGMSRIRAFWSFKAVRRFAAFAASPANKRKVFTAP